MENKISKVSLLWVTIMVGFAMHMLADLLPLFWGANIAIEGSTGEAPTGMLVLMICISFFVPACGLACMNYRQHKALRIANLVLASIMMLFNIFHALELFTAFNPVQLFVHPVMAVLGVYLFIHSLRLVRQQD